MMLSVDHELGANIKLMDATYCRQFLKAVLSACISW